MGQIFGTDGLRGQVGTVITSSLLQKVGYCFAKELLLEGPILIGKDTRESSEMIIQSLSEGIMAAGKNKIWDIGVCPTPALPLIIQKNNCIGGIMISASHNPPEDNGVKLFNKQGIKLTESEQNRIENSISNLNFDTNADTNSQRSNQLKSVLNKSFLLNQYKQSLIDSIEDSDLTGLKIVLDLCHGSATSCAKNIFESVGAKINTINDSPDGKKINVLCGSTYLDPIQNSVLLNKADMGFSFDGDADRVIAIDEKGRVLNGDHILLLIGNYMKSKNLLKDNLIIGTVMSNLGLEKKWEANGGTFKRTSVGDQNIYEELKSTNCNLGGEQSGHILSSFNNFIGDGILTALKIAQICSTKGRTLAELLDESFTPYPQKLINVYVPNRELRLNWSQITEITTTIQKAEKELYHNGRILVRSSGTQPLIRIMVEAISESSVDRWSSEISSIIQEKLG
tara:strand:+ start:323 stop:1684 length:1362 start_codon:yes stop_codon:yes gene_type:complete